MDRVGSTDRLCAVQLYPPTWDVSGLLGLMLARCSVCVGYILRQSGQVGSMGSAHIVAMFTQFVYVCVYLGLMPAPHCGYVHQVGSILALSWAHIGAMFAKLGPFWVHVRRMLGDNLAAFQKNL